MKITVLKPAKSADAKPSNYCPWLIDEAAFQPKK
jgi:hypothetical protein